jgi:predicted O-methyltransferase YrrM
VPPLVAAAASRARQAGFPMSCDPAVGQLLAVLAAHLPTRANVAELGAGVGTAWITSGLLPRTDVKVTTIENDRQTAALAARGDWPSCVSLRYGQALGVFAEGGTYDLIFADAPEGKWYGLAQPIAALAPHGMLVVDDMAPMSLYAHGMSVRDIMHHLEQVYGTQLSHETVSRITDAVLEEVRAWQSRPLDPACAAVFLDAIVVKVRDNQVVQSKPAYIAIGVDADGEKHVLGIWLAKTPPQSATAGEGARFWRSVMADLRNRGVRDILIACVDGLAGFEDAITAAFPHAVVQRCVARLIRNALRPVARRDAGEVA